MSYSIYQVNGLKVVATATDENAAQELCGILEALYGLLNYTEVN